MTDQLSITAAAPLNFEAAMSATEAVIRAHSKTFFFATGLLPPPQRSAIRALYGFCRASDDLVDCADTSLAGLDAWRAQVNLPADRQTNPLLLAWASVRERYGIDRTHERELLDGIEMDLVWRPYRNWDELQLYCYRVASTVGLLSMPVIGLAPGAAAEQAQPYAVKLGIALQLTNILRDVGEDLTRGRVYIPDDDLARFALSPRDLYARQVDERFIALMRFEIARARTLYEESLPGITLLHPAARPAVGAAALLYCAILDEIERNGYDVFRRRAHTTALRKLRMLPGILWKVSRLRRPSIA